MYLVGLASPWSGPHSARSAAGGMDGAPPPPPAVAVEGLGGMVTGAPSLPVTRASHSSWEGENTPPKNDTTIAMLIVMGREAVGVGSGGVML
jgi:hypothetical protein